MLHDAFTIGFPLLAILAGILLNRAHVKELSTEMQAQRTETRSEINALRSEMRSEIKDLRTEIQDLCTEIRTGFAAIHADIVVLQSDMRQFYHLTGKLEGRIEATEKR